MESAERSQTERAECISTRTVETGSRGRQNAAVAESISWGAWTGASVTSDLGKSVVEHDRAREEAGMAERSRRALINGTDVGMERSGIETTDIDSCDVVRIDVRRLISVLDVVPIETKATPAVE